MANNQKPVAIYAGDTFRNSMRQYSFERMARDPIYRREVRKAKAIKKAARKPNETDNAVAVNPVDAASGAAPQ